MMRHTQRWLEVRPEESRLPWLGSQQRQLTVGAKQRVHRGRNERERVDDPAATRVLQPLDLRRLDVGERRADPGAQLGVAGGDAEPDDAGGAAVVDRQPSGEVDEQVGDRHGQTEKNKQQDGDRGALPATVVWCEAVQGLLGSWAGSFKAGYGQQRRARRAPAGPPAAPGPAARRQLPR